MMSYGATKIAAYLGYVIQAVVNNLTPLLFVTFQEKLGISTAQIAVLIAVNFCVQILSDLSAAFFADRIGYRACVALAHIFVVSGFSLFSFLPYLIEPYTALLVSTVLCAVGGGLLEVMISPIIEALPSKNKARQMALSHSFYCWGQMAVMIVSSLFFVTAGIDRWQFLPLLWALVPLMNLCLFMRVPILTLHEEKQAEAPSCTPNAPRQYKMKSSFFFVCIVLMFCAGATELTVSQWASMFAEKGLHIQKSVGDLLGPCSFAAMMGIGRLLFARLGGKGGLEKWLALSGALGAFAYLLTALSPIPAFSLIGCMLAGLASALLWPGTYSLGSTHMRAGGTAMFAFFAMAGDIGCAAGPAFAGLVSGFVEKGGRLFPFFDSYAPTNAGLRSGFFVGAIFPLALMLFSIYLYIKARREKKSSNIQIEKNSKNT